MVAIDLANASASQGFDLSTAAVAGRATHQVVGGPQGLDEGTYTALRRAGLGNQGIATAPILSEYVTSDQLGGQPLQLLGVDPFAEAPFRSYVANDVNQPGGGRGAPAGQLTAFLTQPGAILLSSDVAERYGLQAGSPITLTVGGYQRPAFVAGLLDPADSLSRRALDGMLLADIATAQELTGRLGKLDRIDVILPEDDPAALQRLEALLPEQASIVPVAARTGTIEQMTAAFRTNLTALSLLALVVGLFLIYNTMTFSVVQRRPLFGTLRCLGVTRNEVFVLVLAEAFVVGLLGATLGVILGVILGQGAVRAVTQTINDLYFVVTVRGLSIPPSSLAKGMVLGVIATVLAAAPPAWEAASVPPRVALSRSGLESKAGRAVKAAALASLVLMGIGLILLALPTKGLVAAFAGTFAIIIGIGMQTPLVTKLAMDAVTPISSRLGGVLGRMAPRSVVNSLSRTAIAIAALMIAVSVTIGVSLMVGSFRYTVIAWLAQTVQGDIYISPPSATATSNSATVDPAAELIIRGWPGVARVDTLRSATVNSPGGPVQIAAVDNPSTGDERLFLSAIGTPDEVWQAMQRGRGDRLRALCQPAGPAAARRRSDPVHAGRPARLPDRRHLLRLRIEPGHGDDGPAALPPALAGRGDHRHGPASGRGRRPRPGHPGVARRAGAGAGAADPSQQSAARGSAGGLRPDFCHHRRAAAAGDPGGLHRRLERAVVAAVGQTARIRYPTCGRPDRRPAPAADLV